MKVVFKVIILMLVIFVPSSVVLAKEVPIYLFYGDTCPICEKEKEYLDELKEKYKNIKLYEFETYKDSTNYQNMLKVKELFSISRNGVPFTVIGDTSIMGFSDSIKPRFESLIEQYTKEDAYRDRTGIYLGYIEDVEVITSEEEVQNEEKDDKKIILEIIIFISLALVIVVGSLITYYFRRKKVR